MKFKKIIAQVIASAIIFATIPACVQAQETVLKLQISSPNMTINGVESEIDPGRGTVPVVDSGRTLVPIRAIIEALGGSVGWDGEKSEVSLTYGDDVIKLVIGSKKAYLNDVESTLDVAPKTINDRTMLPIRYIAESFNFKVDWDGGTSTVTITKAENVKSESTNVTESTREESFDVHDNPEDMIDEEPGYDVEEIDPEEEEMEEETYNSEYEEELLSEMNP